jgi:hypothetical protein
MDHYVPPGDIPMSRDWGWYLTLVVIGVIAGSVASFGFRGNMLRNVVIGVFVALGIGLACEAAGVQLPFEPWLKALVNGTVGALGRWFMQFGG